MENCVFCRIARGEIPALKVYEDDKVISFLDINPYVRGHVMIVPKAHSRWLWDMDIKDYEYLMQRTHHLANALRKTFDTDWVEVVVAGIGVPHTHVHLLPRQESDGLGEIPTKPLVPKPSDKEMKEIAEKIRKNLR